MTLYPKFCDTAINAPAAASGIGTPVKTAEPSRFSSIISIPLWKFLHYYRSYSLDGIYLEVPVLIGTGPHPARTRALCSVESVYGAS